ncbi:MAG: ribosome recycling factor [Pedosphaera sp.]|nr:ribosome recycling factor [Pedosphaera sp.]PHX93291.1 MAG: ribosome recycling factor [Pedosphaera sp.]
MALDDVLLDAEEKMLKSEQHMEYEFSGVRTGKASPALVENIQAEVYGSMMRIKELANISVPESRMLLIQPWDQGSVGPIEKAIQKANLGLNPAVQGKFIRIVLPDLSTETREKFVKMVKHMAETGKIAIRQIRRDAIEAVKKEGKNGGISEDEVETAEGEVQKLTDQYIKKLDVHLAVKEAEILKV